MSGVASRNPFALLGDDADVAAANAPTPKAAPQAPAPSSRTTQTPSQPRTQNNNNNNRTARGGSRGGARNAAPRGDGAEEQAVERQPREDRGAGRGRGEGRGRGGGRGRGAPRGGGRQFDRHSQTGREDTEKKTAQGWGAQDGEAVLEAEESGKADAAGESAEGVTAAVNGASEKPAPIPEEEDNSKTYEEFLAEKNAKRAQLGVANKEERNLDQSAWDKLQATKVDREGPEEEYYAAKEKTTKARAARKEKQTIEIDARFEAPAGSSRGGRGGNRGGDRGDRGGNRGRGAGRGRGGPRAPRGASSAGVNLADQSAFPSLG